MVAQSTSKNRTLIQNKEEVRTGLILSLCLFVIYVTTVFFIYRNIHIGIHQNSDRRQFQELNSMSEKIYDIFTRIEVYLVHSSNLYSVRHILKEDELKLRREVEHFFSKLIEVNGNRFSPTFDQIRLLDLNGREKVRVDLDINNNAKVCPVSQLQDKSNRYYFREAIPLSNNQIYMSPLDLNIEQGKIERPYKPMIRFAVPVFDIDGKRIGLLSFNYRAQQMFNDIDTMNLHKGDHWILLNKDGYYLHGIDPDKDFGFMFHEPKIGFFSDNSNLWTKISNTKEKKIHHSDGVYYRNDITPFVTGTLLTVSKPHKWTLLMFVPNKNIHERDLLLNRGIAFASSIIAPIIMILGWFLGKYRVRNKWHIKNLEESATLDGMTGLYNHREAIARLEYQINASKRLKHPLCISYIDLNNLKLLNDTLGHKSGDQIIIAVADSIKNSIRTTDIAARIGGDEFLVIFPNIETDNIKKIIQRIELLYSQRTQELFIQKLTLSWGVSSWNGMHDTAVNLINRADKNMYKMKKWYKRSSS